MNHRRSGFTLVELLVVIGILLILTALVVAAFRISAGGDRLRSAARTTQSAFLGAKDRALHAKDRRGVRLLRDSGDGSLCNGFIYLQPIEMQTYGLHSVQLERPDFDNNGTEDNANILIARGNTTVPIYPQTDWYAISSFFANPPRIRIPAVTGQWYTFTTSTVAPYVFGPTNQVLILTTPVQVGSAPPTGIVAVNYTDSTITSCDLEMAPEILPNHAPIQLPSGVVIDLFYSQIPAMWYPGQRSVTAGTALNAGEVDEGPDPANAANHIYRIYAPNMELMYSPRGTVTGAIAAQGPIHLLLRDIQDATQGLSPISPQCKGECRVLTVFPQTGHVQVYEMNPTDNFINVTQTAAGPTAGQDFYPDDPFYYAKLGSRAGN